MKIAGKLIRKISVWILASVLGLALLLIVGLNIVKFFLYSDYYEMRTNLCDNPGISDGFMCQGICVWEEGDKILLSGYMKDHSASRIYITDTQNRSHYVTLKLNGEDFKGHSGGIACHGETIFIASDSALHWIDLKDVVNAENGAEVEIFLRTPVNNHASFVFANEDYIYVGEFHNGGAYVTEHPYETPDGTHYAIVSRYQADDLTKPDKIYSIRNKVQGICFTDEGEVILSTSYGLTDSVYYIYEENKAVDSGLTLDGAPVYFLTEVKRQFNGPAMSEGLAEYKGQVITMTESASDKYIFGKFFFADQIVSLDLSK